MQKTHTVVVVKSEGDCDSGNVREAQSSSGRRVELGGEGEEYWPGRSEVLVGMDTRRKKVGQGFPCSGANNNMKIGLLMASCSGNLACEQML